MPVTSVAVHAFPECKEIWTQLDSTSQKKVLALGSRIWDAPENEVGESISKELLHELESRGVLVQEDGKWCFTLPQMLFFVQSINLIDSLSLQSRTASELLQDLVELFWRAKTHSFRKHKDYQNLVSFVIAQLVNEFDRLDLIELVISEETLNQNFQRFYEPICQALPILELSVENFAAVLRGVANRVQGDLAGVRIYSATEYLGRFRPEFTFELVDSLAAIEDWGTSGFLEKLLTGIAMASPDHFDIVVARSEAWLDSDTGNLCQAALYCLQSLILNGKLEPNRLLSRADSLASKSMDGFRHALSGVIAILGASFEQCAEECLDVLQRLKEEGPLDQVTHGIATALSRTRDDAAFDFKISCLPLLTDVPIANKGTIKEIDWLLYPIARSHPGEVWKYLEEWILAHELKESVTEHSLFLSTVQNAYECDPNLGSLVVTRWFALPDLRLVEEARSILRELKIHGFAAREINSMSPQIIMYITEKLLVGRLESTQMIWLCHNILQNTSKIEELEDYFLRVLRYLTWNYPGSTKEFFDQVVDEKDTTKASLLVQRARQELKEYQEQHKGIFVAELLPSKRRVEKYVEFEGKRRQRIQEASFDDDRFPLQKLLPRVMIGRGDRTFHMNVFHPDITQRRTFSEPRGFGEFFKSIELPRGEFIDPEGEAWSRFRRLNYRPDDFQKESA